MSSSISILGLIAIISACKFSLFLCECRLFLVSTGLLEKTDDFYSSSSSIFSHFSFFSFCSFFSTFPFPGKKFADLVICLPALFVPSEERALLLDEANFLEYSDGVGPGVFSSSILSS